MAAPQISNLPTVEHLKNSRTPHLIVEPLIVLVLRPRAPRDSLGVCTRFAVNRYLTQILHQVFPSCFRGIHFLKMEGILEKAIANLQNEFPGEANTRELLVRVQEILPMKDTEYEIVDVKGTGNNFKANIKMLRAPLRHSYHRQPGKM